MNAPRHVSHYQVVVDMLKADPEIADVYLATALEEANLPGGQFALLMVTLTQFLYHSEVRNSGS